MNVVPGGTHIELLKEPGHLTVESRPGIDTVLFLPVCVNFKKLPLPVEISVEKGVDDVFGA